MKFGTILAAFAALALVAGCGAKVVQSVAAPAPAAGQKAPTPTPATATQAPTAQPVQPTVAKTGEGSPLAVIQVYTAELREMVGLNERKQKGIRDEDREKKVQTKVREFFDFPMLARLSLGRHWKTVTWAQQQEYSSLFIELVEDSYIRRSRDLVGNYELTFTGEETAGDRAKVTCRVARSDADVDISYQLHKKDGKWMIYNIILDNVDLIQNYQSQFNSIILKYGWNDLIKRMQKKLDTAAEEEPAF
ncbi:MAG: ABC transporter substrate-binding protein [Pseudomonadota bacterium]